MDNIKQINYPLPFNEAADQFAKRIKHTKI